MLVAGADGCRAGWFLVVQDIDTGCVTQHTLPTFAQVLRICSPVAVLGIDMPVGLMDCAEKGGRPVDRMARERLKPHRSSSVFSPPCRAALACSGYEEAVSATRANSPAGRSLTLQSFGLFPKLREVDEAITAELQERVREVHPELSFARMNGGVPLEISKKHPEGQQMRIALLAGTGFDISPKTVKKWARAGVGRTDVLDAYAACWTAGRIARGEAEGIPAEPDIDRRGLRMQLWV